MSAPTQSERMAKMEVELTHLSNAVEKLTGLVEKQDEQLRELLALRNKGAGVFWLASVLFGTSLFGAVSVLWKWLNG